MGGIATDVDGETPLPGLFAAGECACVSVHGANRLGGNSLLETLVFGARAGKKAAQRVGKQRRRFKQDWLFQDQLKGFQSGLEEIFEREGKEPCFRLRDEMKAIMTSQVGIFRKESDLLLGQRKDQGIEREDCESWSKQKSLAFNHELIQYLDLEGMLHVAEVIVEGALARKESRGSHFRTDFPKRDDEHWLRHTLALQNTGRTKA